MARRDGAETSGTERRMECLGNGAGQGAVGRPLYVAFEEGTKPLISVYRGQQGHVSAPDASHTIPLRGQEHEPHHGTKKEAGAHEKPKEGGEAGLVGDRGAHVLVQDAIGFGVGEDGEDEGAVETVFEFEKDTIHAPLDRRLLGIRHGIVIEATGFLGDRQDKFVVLFAFLGRLIGGRQKCHTLKHRQAEMGLYSIERPLRNTKPNII